MQDNACARSELSASIIPRASVDSLNLASGLSGSIIMDLLQNALKDEKVTDIGNSLRYQVEESKKRMTAGIIFKCGQVVLDEKVLELVEEK